MVLIKQGSKLFFSHLVVIWSPKIIKKEPELKFQVPAKWYQKKKKAICLLLYDVLDGWPYQLFYGLYMAGIKGKKIKEKVMEHTSNIL